MSRLKRIMQDKAEPVGTNNADAWRERYVKLRESRKNAKLWKAPTSWYLKNHDDRPNANETVRRLNLAYTQDELNALYARQEARINRAKAEVSNEREVSEPLRAVEKALNDKLSKLQEPIEIDDNSAERITPDAQPIRTTKPLTRLQRAQQAEKETETNNADTSNEETTSNDKTPEPSKPSKPLSRLDRIKAKSLAADQAKADASFINRSIGQQSRKDREPDIVTPKKEFVAERTEVMTRLERLMGAKEGERTTGSLVKVQLNTDDSHLATSGENGTSKEHAERLYAIELEAAYDENMADPFKMVPYELLDPSQKHAVENVGEYQYAIINGPAGTGKTTVTQHAVSRAAEQLGKRPVSQLRRGFDSDQTAISTIGFVAFTGKASQNMREKLPEEFREYNVMTIHRMLGYYPEYEEYIDEKGQVKERRVFVPSFTAETPLNWDIIVIDEAGMAPAKLVNELIAAAPNAQIIFIGDSAQLPAVTGLAPFNVYLTTLPTFTLDTVHRTEETALVVNATNIRNGIRPHFNKQNAHHKMISVYNDKAQVQCYSAIKALSDAKSFDPKYDSIIMLVNDNDMGQIRMNTLLRKVFNPDAKQIRINAVTQTCRYAVNDKVMVTSNDDDAGLTNGMTGWIVDIEKNGKYTRPDISEQIDAAGDIDFSTMPPPEDEEPGRRQASHITYVYFPTAYGSNKVIPFASQGAYSSLQLGYATTCHKAQGSEYRNVVVIMHPSGKRLINREWFYTAWTRAKESVYVLADEGSMARARNKQHLVGANVTEKAENFIAKHRTRIEKNTKVFFEESYGSGNHPDFEWGCPIIIEN